MQRLRLSIQILEEAPMKLPYDLIIFDVESNQPSGKIIEIGAVRLSRTFVLETPGFQSFVNPQEPITKDIIELCQLDQDTLNKIENSPNITAVVKDMYTWGTQTGKNVCLASWGNYDVSELHRQAPTCQFRRKAIDIKSILAWESARYGLKTTNSLSASCDVFGVSILKPQHRAYPDALTTAKLLQEVWAMHKRFKHSLDFTAKALA